MTLQIVPLICVQRIYRVTSFMLLQIVTGTCVFPTTADRTWLRLTASPCLAHQGRCAGRQLTQGGQSCRCRAPGRHVVHLSFANRL